MYPVAIVGDNIEALTAQLACRRSGFNDVTTFRTAHGPAEPIDTQVVMNPLTLGANSTRILQTLGTDDVATIAHLPDREQVRLNPSGFLLTELPLGEFFRQRHGAPHINVLESELLSWLGKAPNVQNQKEDFLTIDEQQRLHLKNEHRLVIITEGESTPVDDSASDNQSYAIWTSHIPTDKPSNANVTWLGDDVLAWQFSTQLYDHTVFCVPAANTPQDFAWHESLMPPLDNATLQSTVNNGLPPVRNDWWDGAEVYLGRACFTGSPFYREASTCGLEDAWVLSRMLENYEEDVAQGLEQYERYRRPRAQRLARHCLKMSNSYLIDKQPAKILRNLNLALSARFLPEIAMQRIDWLYGHDCIRGFR